MLTRNAAEHAPCLNASVYILYLLRSFQALIFHSVPPFEYRQSMNWLCLLLLVISMFHLFSRRVDVDLDRPRPRRGRDRILSIGYRHEFVVCGNWLDALKDAAGFRLLDCCNRMALPFSKSTWIFPQLPHTTSRDVTVVLRIHCHEMKMKMKTIDVTSSLIVKV